MKLVKISDLFEVRYGTNLELIHLNEMERRTNESVCFVSRTENNNGVSAFVEKIRKIKSISAGTISVSGGGSVLEAFLQPFEYYSGRDLYCLTPKNAMTERELIFYCICIRRNKYRYNYGRQANKTLRDILIPASVPNKFLNLEIKKPSNKPVHEKKVILSDRQWKWFRYDELFDVKKGKRLTKEDMTSGKTPFIGSSELDNGVTAHINRKPIHLGNTLSVTYNGNVAEAFYQSENFWASDDVNVLYPKFSLNKYRALFLVAIIRKEKYRYSYGRKWHLDRMRESKMKLPVDVSGKPDWNFMESFIKSLPYSAEV